VCRPSPSQHRHWYWHRWCFCLLCKNLSLERSCSEPIMPMGRQDVCHTDTSTGTVQHLALALTFATHTHTHTHTHTCSAPVLVLARIVQQTARHLSTHSARGANCNLERRFTLAFCLHNANSPPTTANSFRSLFRTVPVGHGPKVRRR